LVKITPTSNSKRGDRRARQNKNSGGSVEVHQLNFPAQFNSAVRLKHKFRFNSSAAATFNIQRGDLLALLAVTTLTTTQTRIITGVKLNQIEMFALSGGSSALPFSTATVSIEWLSNNGPTNEISDTGNAFEPARVITSPPRLSLASFWSIQSGNETENLCSVVVVPNTVIDVWVEFVFADGEVPTTITTIASGVTGQLYAGYLDRHEGAAAVMVPVSYISLN
jgi:hypothetical protein